MDSGDEAYKIQAQVTFKRWFILGIFCSITLLSAFQWNNLIIIPKEVKTIFNSSMPESITLKSHLMDLLSTSYQIFYVIFMIPSSIIMDRKGLRFCGLISISLVLLGCWIKTIAVHIASPRETISFPILLIGQFLCAISNSFVLAIPSFLSANWFSEKEIAMATSIGVLGNQLGIAFGFFLPPLIVGDLSDYDELKVEMLYLQYIGSILATITFFIVVFCYQSQPEHPPNKAQALKRKEIEVFLPENSDYITTDFSVTAESNPGWKSLVRRKDFILLTLSYGLMVGVFYGISTLIDKILDVPFKDFPSGSGYAGTIIVVSGIFGSILCGFALQKTGKYKIVNSIVYLASLLGMIGFLLAVEYNSPVLIFILSGVLGFFMTGYLPLGFEFAAEITYPINEDLSSGILNTSAQIFGIILVIIPRIMIESYGVLYANIFLTACMVGGFIMKLFIKERLLRRKI